MFKFKYWTQVLYTDLFIATADNDSKSFSENDIALGIAMKLT